VNKNSTPSQLRITDMRSVLVASNYLNPAHSGLYRYRQTLC
jgi:hypothetical protein